MEKKEILILRDYVRGLQDIMKSKNLVYRKTVQDPKDRMEYVFKTVSRLRKENPLWQAHPSQSGKGYLLCFPDPKNSGVWIQCYIVFDFICVDAYSFSPSAELARLKELKASYEKDLNELYLALLMAPGVTKKDIIEIYSLWEKYDFIELDGFEPKKLVDTILKERSTLKYNSQRVD